MTLDRDVALKVLLRGANGDRFVRESKITARLPHPGIPPVYALGTLADGSPFLAMKLIAGRTLADEMKNADQPRLLQAFLQVCQTVGFAHSRGIIHRDLKPANVMVGAFGEVQVMDWGLAKDLSSRESEHHGQASVVRPERPCGERRSRRDDRSERRRGSDGRADAGRAGDGHAGVHGAGAGARRGHRCAVRRVRAGRHPLRRTDRAAGLPWQIHARSRWSSRRERRTLVRRTHAWTVAGRTRSCSRCAGAV